MSSPDYNDHRAVSAPGSTSRSRQPARTNVRLLPTAKPQAVTSRRRLQVILEGTVLIFQNLPATFDHLPGRSLADLRDALHNLSVDVADTYEGGVSLDVRVAPQTVLELIETYQLNAGERALAGLNEALKTNWRERALCKEVDPEIFFPEKGGPVAQAKKLCRRCPVRDECLAYALEAGERYGVWGGKSERERRRLKPAFRSSPAAAAAADFPTRRVG